MSSSKKLKMERLSPIPMVNRASGKLSDSSRAPTWCVTPSRTIRKRKDCYAIESTSSPEVNMQPTCSQKPKRASRSAARCRNRGSSNKPVTTPLSGLIARKSVCQPSKELPPVSDSRARSGLNFASCTGQLHTIEEVETVDDEVGASPLIGAFNSPLKPKFPNAKQYTERLTPTIVFPSMQPSNASNNAPLTGIITKTSFGPNRSLNDSLSILVNADVEMFNNKAEDPVVVSPPIESFESPAKIQKPLPLDKDLFDVSCSNFCAPSNLDSSTRHLVLIKGTTSKFDANVEMSGSERKKRKRSLDFSLALPLSEVPEDRTDVPKSPILVSKSFREALPAVEPLDMPKLDSAFQQGEVSNENSDADSIVEGTPSKVCKFSRVIEDETLSGFQVCSSLLTDSETPFECSKDVAPIIEQNSPPTTPQPQIEILEEASNDAFPGLPCDLRLVCQDTSSDESEVGCSINEIDDKSCFIAPDAPSSQNASPQSPSLNFNFTRREIRPYESPSKPTKVFSEAVNIDAFGSPDSTTSDVEAEVVQELERCDIANVAAVPEEDEFMDESEQLRPTKRRKKGSLLERAGFIISKTDASQALFDYEIKAGLRPSTGKFVSSPLVICKMWAGDNSTHFLVCTSLKSCTADPQERSEAEHPSIVGVIANKIPKELSEGCVVLLQYPLTALYSDIFRIPYILAGNQLMPAPNIPNVTDPCALCIPEIEMRTCIMENPTSTSLKVFPFSSIKNLEDAILCQCLVDSFELTLRVLHVIDVSSPTKKVMVLCCDVEDNFGWVSFTQARDVKRATALEVLRILSDGALVTVKGFHVAHKQVLDKKTRNLLSYCLNENVKSYTVFTIVPVDSAWVVSSSGGPRDAKKVSVSIDNILSLKAQGKRFLIQIASWKVDQNQNIYLTDPVGGTVGFIQGQQAPKIRFELLSSPFFLDGVYYYDGRIFSDEYTKLLEKLPSTKL